MAKKLKNQKFDADTIRLTDKHIKALLKSLKTKSAFKIDDTLSDELDGYMDVTQSLKSRAKRIPYGINGPEDLGKIGKLFSKCQAYKTRVRIIDVQFLSLEYALDELRGKASSYVRDRYYKELSELKNKEDRAAVIDRILEDVDKIVSRAAFIREKAGIVLENLTDTHWTLTATKGIAELFMPRDMASGYKGSNR